MFLMSPSFHEITEELRPMKYPAMGTPAFSPVNRSKIGASPRTMAMRSLTDITKIYRNPYGQHLVPASVAVAMLRFITFRPIEFRRTLWRPAYVVQLFIWHDCVYPPDVHAFAREGAC